MNKSQRAIAVRLLEAAKLTLTMDRPFGDGVSRFICDNLEVASKDPKFGKKAKATYAAHRALRALIAERLGNRFGVSLWLIDQGLIDGCDSSIETFQAVQVFRQRWMDELIRELSA